MPPTINIALALFHCLFAYSQAGLSAYTFSEQSHKYAIIELHGPIGTGFVFKAIDIAIKNAEKTNVDTLIVDLDSHSGDFRDAELIAQLLLDCDLTIVAVVNSAVGPSIWIPAVANQVFFTDDCVMGINSNVNSDSSLTDEMLTRLQLKASSKNLGLVFKAMTNPKAKLWTTTDDSSNLSYHDASQATDPTAIAWDNDEDQVLVIDSKNAVLLRIGNLLPTRAPIVSCLPQKNWKKVTTPEKHFARISRQAARTLSEFNGLQQEFLQAINELDTLIENYQKLLRDTKGSKPPDYNTARYKPSYRSPFSYEKYKNIVSDLYANIILITQKYNEAELLRKSLNQKIKMVNDFRGYDCIDSQSTTLDRGLLQELDETYKWVEPEELWLRDK